MYNTLKINDIQTRQHGTHLIELLINSDQHTYHAGIMPEYIPTDKLNTSTKKCEIIRYIIFLFF